MVEGVCHPIHRLEEDSPMVRVEKSGFFHVIEGLGQGLAMD